TGILFGALPAWRVAHAEPQQALKAGAVTITEARPARRLRESLIGFEVGVGKGFTTEHVLAADVSLPPWSYTKFAQKQEFYENVLARVRALPGVISAGWISRLPLQGEEKVDSIYVPGQLTPRLQSPVANYRYVSPGYFESMGILLRRGRLIEPADR